MSLEPYAPQEAVTDFLEDQRDGQAKNTVQNYKYALRPFVDFCHENQIENLNNLTGRLKEFKQWRGQEVQITTLRNQMWTLKKFMRFCQAIEAVPHGLPMKVESLVPPRDGDESRDEYIEAQTADMILEYLKKYEYASLRHVTFLLLWRTAARQGSLHALDVGDLVEDPPMVKIRHRPDTGTPLKNKSHGERNVPLSKEDVKVGDATHGLAGATSIQVPAEAMVERSPRCSGVEFVIVYAPSMKSRRICIFSRSVRSS